MSNPPDKPYQRVLLPTDVNAAIALLNQYADQGLYFQGMLPGQWAVVGNYSGRGGN